MSPKHEWHEALARAVRPGDVIANKYRIDHLIGAGGMGMVMEAWHLGFDERVAIKFLLPERVGNPEARSRFEREARAAFRIRSQHVAQVIDIGVLESDIPYMVMEFLQGATLAELLVEQGTFDVETAADFVLQACEAVAEAHALGIVHRDLKPANLFLTHRADGAPCIKVLDFGLAKAGYSRGSLTTVHRSMGTPKYMSPEQWVSARDVGPPTDIWAFGAALFELLSGRGPFPTRDVNELCQMALTSVAPRLSSVRPDVPPAFDELVAKCLERNPRHRFANVQEFAAALAEFAQPLARRLGSLRPSGPGHSDPVAVQEPQEAAAQPWSAEPPAEEPTARDDRLERRQPPPEEPTAPTRRADPTMVDVHPGPAARAAAAEYGDYGAEAQGQWQASPDGDAGGGHPELGWLEEQQAALDDGESDTRAFRRAIGPGERAPKVRRSKGKLDEPEIEWSEDGLMAEEMFATEVMRYEPERPPAPAPAPAPEPDRPEATTKRLRRERKKKRRRRSRRGRKALRLLLLAAIGFASGAVLAKVHRAFRPARPAAVDAGSSADEALGPGGWQAVETGDYVDAPPVRFVDLDDESKDAGSDASSETDDEPLDGGEKKRGSLRGRRKPRGSRRGGGAATPVIPTSL